MDIAGRTVAVGIAVHIVVDHTVVDRIAVEGTVAAHTVGGIAVAARRVVAGIAHIVVDIVAAGPCSAVIVGSA